MSSSSTTPGPYNVTVSDDSPTINYLPYRDGPLTGGWNITCTGSDDLTWFPQSFCVGPSSHRTSYIGASLSIEFEGTAAYLYGTAPSGSYVLQVDNQVTSSPNPSPGLLAKVEGLTHGPHTLYLNVTQANLVSFSEVVLTIGVEIGASSSDAKNRTIVPFTVDNSGLATLNSEFSYTGTWFSDTPGTIGATGNTLYPRQHTEEAGASVSFTLNETSAFFVYGLVNLDLALFTVAVQPPSDLGPTVTTNFNSSSRWISLDQLMFWQSGLDRNRQYTVTITNQGQGDTPWWDFSRIDLIDGQPSSSIGGSSSHKHGLSGGAMGGIIAGAIVLLLTLVACFLTRKRIKRTIYPEDKAPPSQLYAGYIPPSLSQNKPSNDYRGPHPYESTPTFTAQPLSLPYNPLQEPLLYAAPPATQIPPMNNQPPPLPPPTGPSSSRTSYLNPNQGGLVALSWNEEQASSHTTITNDVSWKGSPRVVQEEDAGGLFSPSENMVRLPPGYQDSWSQGR